MVLEKPPLLYDLGNRILKNEGRICRLWYTLRYALCGDLIMSTLTCFPGLLVGRHIPSAGRERARWAEYRRQAKRTLSLLVEGMPAID